MSPILTLVYLSNVVLFVVLAKRSIILNTSSLTWSLTDLMISAENFRVSRASIVLPLKE